VVTQCNATFIKCSFYIKLKGCGKPKENKKISGKLKLKRKSVKTKMKLKHGRGCWNVKSDVSKCEIMEKLSKCCNLMTLYNLLFTISASELFKKAECLVGWLQYGREAAGGVGHVPTGWDVWHGLVRNHFSTFFVWYCSICYCLYHSQGGATLLLLCGPDREFGICILT